MQHEHKTTNDFPRLGIVTADLVAEVNRLLDQAKGEKASLGAVNWGDLGVVDVEYRLSILRPQDGPCCVVTVEEASPEAALARWLNDRLDKVRFPNTYIECEW